MSSSRSLVTNLTLQVLNNASAVFITEDLTEKCHICNDTYENDTICRKNLSCNHFFHRGCIDTWYSEHNTCPICNQVIQ